MSAAVCISGRCWVLGDNVTTDALAPGRFMKFGVDVIAQHCLQDVLPRFAQEVRPGDVMVAGNNFGAGSSREQAVQALLHLGVGCVVAPSFAGLFYRNAFNLGLPLLVGTPPAQALQTGDEVRIDLDRATLDWDAGRQRLQCSPIPAHLRALIADGGLVGHLEQRLARQRSHPHNEGHLP